MASLCFPQMRVDQIAQGIAQEIDSQSAQKDGSSWKSGKPPLQKHIVAPFRKHSAPRRCRRLDSQAEEAEQRLLDNGSSDFHGPQDKDARQQVGQNMAEEDSCG